MKSRSLDDLIPVYRCSGRLEAEMVKGFLEAQGVPVEFDQDTLGAIYGLTSGDLGEVHILVDPENAQQARTLLEAMQRGDYANEVLVGVPQPSDDGSAALNTDRKKVLFLCTGNSARSQLAEAWVNQYLSEQWEAYSAGVEPAEALNPFSTQLLSDANIPHEGYPKSPEELQDIDFDLVVTVCDHAKETCPVWLKTGSIEHFGMVDPAGVHGTDEEKLQAFRRTWELISEQMPGVLAKHNGE